MFSAQPLADLSVCAPWMVARLTWENDVQVGLLRSLQLPLDDQVMPDDRNLDVASECVSFVTYGPTSADAAGRSKTGSTSPGCTDACAPVVVSSNAVAAEAAATNARTTI